MWWSYKLCLSKGISQFHDNVSMAAEKGRVTKITSSLGYTIGAVAGYMTREKKNMPSGLFYRIGLMVADVCSGRLFSGVLVLGRVVVACQMTT